LSEAGARCLYDADANTSATPERSKTDVWDPAEHLETEEDIAAHRDGAFEEGDPSLFAAVLGDIARANGMAQIARDAGLGRESLYKALSPDGNPEFATIMKVVSALGLKLRATQLVE
jgi:probable addiction module antidote protein